MTCVLVRKYHIPYMFQDAIVALQTVDKNEAQKEIGRVTSRAYDRSRNFFLRSVASAMGQNAP